MLVRALRRVHRPPRRMDAVLRRPGAQHRRRAPARLPGSDIRVMPGVVFLDDDVREHPGRRAAAARATSCSSSRASRAPCRVRPPRAATCGCPATGGADPASPPPAPRSPSSSRTAGRWSSRTGSTSRPPCSRRGTAVPRPPRRSPGCSATPSPPAGCRCRSRGRSARSRSTTRTRTPAGRRAPGNAHRGSVDIGLHGPDNVHDRYTSKYLDLDLGPQFAFGHGSGYAAFAHSAPRGSHDEIALDALERGDVTSSSTSRTRPTAAATR